MRVYYHNKYHLLLLCGLLCLAAGCANQTHNQLSLDEFSKASGHILQFVKDNAPGWPQRTFTDAKESFLRADNITILLSAGGASIALHSSGADENTADYFEDHHNFHGFADESLNIIGHPWTLVGASALWYGFSKNDGDELSAERAKAMIAALSLSSAVTMGAKAVRDNDCPNGKNWAWPSGHTAATFTVASMLDEYYGPKAGIPAYAIASLISYRMLDTGDHWTSDIVFGAALGWVVGHTLADRQKQLEIAGFQVLPYTAYIQKTDSTAIGVNLVKKF